MAWQVPDTRPSILLRLRDPSDQEAWSIFESIYRPAIVHAAGRRGLQSADAEDVAQVVLTGLSHRGDRFSTDCEGAKFRTWLARVTENAIIDHVRKQNRESQRVASEADETTLAEVNACLELEYRREVFRWAAGIVRREFSRDAWQSFWLTAIESRPVEDVALELDRSIGSVYSNRSRIMRRLRQQVRLFDDGLEAEL